MNLSELQSVQSTERQSDSLQRLRNSFYADAGEFISELRAERAAAVEAADDPFGDETVRRLSDDIETARSTVEAIYERRVGKVVKMASLAAADMPTDEAGLTAEEAALFEDLVAAIRENRREVMAAVDEDADAEDVPDGLDDGPDVDAADVMGSDADGSSPDRQDAAAEATDAPPPAETAPEEPADGPREAPAQEAESDASAEDPAAGEDVPRTTVRITRDVGEIFGVDDRAYDLSTDDVVTLPAPNAEPLVADGAAEPLE